GDEARDAASARELRGCPVHALQRGDFVTATVHDQQGSRRGAMRGSEGADERGIRLRASANLDDARHCGSPSVSAKPAMMFAFCSAWPAAPFTRLSMADVTSSVGVRVPAMFVAVMRTTLRRTTSARAGCCSTTSMNGSFAYAS